MRHTSETDSPFIQIPDHPLSLKSLDQFDAKDYKFLDQPFVPLGSITVIEGVPGSHKSTYGLDLAARVSTGQMEDVVGPAGVVFLSAEDSPNNTLRGRVEVAGGDLSRIEVLDPSECEKQLLLPNDMDFIEAACRRIDARLVVIDPLAAFINGSSSNEVSVRQMFTPLFNMALRLDLAVVIIRHLSKAPGNNPTTAGGGSTSISGAARSVLLFSVDPDDDNMRVLAHSICNIVPKGKSRKFEVVNTEIGQPMIKWRGASTHTAESLLEAMNAKIAAKSKLAEAMEFLRQILRSAPLPEKYIRAQAHYLGVSPATLHRAKSRLKIQSEKNGFGGEWSWKLPEDDQVGKVAHLGDGTATTTTKSAAISSGSSPQAKGDQGSQDDQLSLPIH